VASHSEQIMFSRVLNPPSGLLELHESHTRCSTGNRGEKEAAKLDKEKKAEERESAYRELVKTGWPGINWSQVFPPVLDYRCHCSRNPSGVLLSVCHCTRVLM
jgi:hypothetical protein